METTQGVSTAVQDTLVIAKGISDYGAVIILAAVMLAYIIWQIRDNIRRQKRYDEQNIGLAQVAEFAKKAADFFSERAGRKVGIEQARAIASTEFNRVAEMVVVQVIKIKEANNLDQVEMVKRNVNTFIDSLYATTEGLLRKFEFDGHALSSFVESNWKERIRQRMLEDCQTHKFDVGRLEDVYRDEFSEYKNIFNQKLDDIHYKKS